MIIVSNLNAKRGTFLLKDINFKVQSGSTLVIMGPNGCGKTTLLECIAGFQKIDSGSIVIDGIDVTHLPPEKRRVGYVPTDYMLFPNTTVQKNIWFAFKRSKGLSLNDLQRIIRLLQIEDLMDKKVEHLSSGQKQRVAIARALATRPHVLLLDEPCSALDPLMREVLKREFSNILKEIFHEFNISTIYTTHDLLEATTIGDKIALMNNGRIEQIGSPKEIFENPQSKFVAEFLGYNVFNGRVIYNNNTSILIDIGGAVLNAQYRENIPEDVKDVVVIIRPQDITLLLTNDVFKPEWRERHCNILNGIVRRVYMEKSIVKVEVEVNNITLRAETNLEYLEKLSIKPRCEVFIHISPSKIKILPRR
jgi:ABC-type sugar transport system ATPase subunit